MLSSTEKAWIDRNGVHYPLPPGLYVRAGGERIVLTVKGIQYFEYARLSWGVQARVSSIKDETSLAKFEYYLERAAAVEALGHVKEALKKGVGTEEERLSAEKLFNDGFISSIIRRGKKFFKIDNVISM